MAASDAERIAALFAGHGGAYGTHGTPTQAVGGLKWEIKTTARTHRGPTTLKMWEAHLKGTTPLGVIPIREDSTCFWSCIDVDKYDVDLVPIIQNVERLKLPLVCARSKSGGLRIYLFLSEPQPAGAVLSVVRDLAARLGLADCEIFPKQTAVLDDRGDVGNWMVMPYYGDTYGGRIREQVGLKRTGAEMTLGEFLGRAEALRLDGDAFAELGRRRTASPPRRQAPRANGAAPEVPFGDGPPCLQHLAAEGVEEHAGRNNALFMMGLYLRRVDPAHWQALLGQANEAYMHPPVTADELTGTIRSIAKKDFEYTCRVQPMAAHCDSALCRTRPYGVGLGGEYPSISGLTQLKTDPCLWFLDVGDHRFEATTEQLWDYNRMLLLFGEQRRVYRLMKRDAWLAVLAEAMTSVQELEAPPDAGRKGHFHEVLEGLLVNRWRGEHVEDLMRGKPWEDQEARRHYFRLQDLAKMLEREGLRGLTRAQIMRYIEDLKGEAATLQVKGKRLNVWWVPSSAVVADPEVPPPKAKGEPI